MFGSWLEVVGTLWFAAVVAILGWVMWPARRRRRAASGQAATLSKADQAPFDAGGGNVGSGNIHLGGGG